MAMSKEEFTSHMRHVTWTLYRTYGIGKYYNHLNNMTSEITREEVLDALQDSKVRESARQQLRDLGRTVDEINALIAESERGNSVGD